MQSTLDQFTATFGWPWLFYVKQITSNYQVATSFRYFMFVNSICQQRTQTFGVQSEQTSFKTKGNGQQGSKQVKKSKLYFILSCNEEIRQSLTHLRRNAYTVLDVRRTLY